MIMTCGYLTWQSGDVLPALLVAYIHPLTASYSRTLMIFPMRPYLPYLLSYSVDFKIP
jgi:hypothetical protein